MAAFDRARGQIRIGGVVISAELEELRLLAPSPFAERNQLGTTLERRAEPSSPGRVRPRVARGRSR